MATRKGEATRQRIVAAAWEAVEELGLEQLLGGVTLREVARRADMSPSMVSYHFSSATELAEAMVDRLIDDARAPVDAPDPLAEPVPRSLGELVRRAAESSWAHLTSPEAQVISRRLMRLRATLADGADGADGEQILERLRVEYAEPHLDRLAASYQLALELYDLHLVEPFDPRLLARVGAALEASLQQQWMVSPEGLSGDLVGDVLVAVASSLTRPGSSRVGIAELEAVLDPRVFDPGVPDAIANLQQIAAAAAPLFADGWDTVSMTDVSELVGVPVGELVATFGTVRRVAAVSFARHAVRLRDAALRRADISPEVSAADLFCELARCVQSDRTATAALIAERMWAAVDGEEIGASDIRVQVPIGAVVAATIERLGDVRTSQVVDLGALMIDTVLWYASTRPDAAPAAVADIAMRLLPGRHTVDAAGVVAPA